MLDRAYERIEVDILTSQSRTP